MRGFVRPTVRETLALNTLERNCRTFPIAHLAGVPFEIPFREIARQMGFADVVMRTEHGAFHEAETALRSVRVRVLALPYLLLATYRLWHKTTLLRDGLRITLSESE